MKTTYGLHWFRRDLRIAGNENLRQNFKENHGRVLGVFFFDSKFLGRADFSANRFAFFIETLKQLKSEFEAQGGELLVVDGQAQQTLPILFEFLKKQSEGLPALVSYGRDYEPYAVKRDAEVRTLIESYGVNVLCQRDHLILEPEEVLKDNRGFYQVFTPYSRRWLEKIQSVPFKDRVLSQHVSQNYFDRLKNNALEKIFQMRWSQFKNLPFKDSLNAFKTENQKSVTIKIPRAGFAAAFEKLQDFKSKMADYTVDRDFPALTGTSGLSIYQKNGSLVPTQIMQQLGLGSQPTQFMKELIWREFYYSILYHRPDVETQSFLPQYKNLKWENDPKKFQRWCEGNTGFPIVDAGMRQLNQTGWMHNRVRMIVASFLTKDLLIDWRWGENYFMKMLLDGDLAPNNGGWQWAASTGCDPQPYFRIFNPWLQAAKFDPDAEYIKHWVPELAVLSAKQIHESGEEQKIKSYPKPMVSHSVQKIKALALFKHS